MHSVISRITALALSPAAALDIVLHGASLFPKIIYACGKSLYTLEVDFQLAWQHLQRVRNAVTPLIF